ncbi:addiction module protein [Oleiharenicola sp. Vm1]|uniref:addiction module protein n=1 Tax=Oleiharenicola sp. Vm1 TaxID=3398393 RepID=UPI0039F5AE17
MTRLQKLGLQAGQLSEAERAALVTRLLASLPPVLADADDGVAEAARRDADLDANPAAGLTDQQFRAAIAASRKR